METRVLEREGAASPRGGLFAVEFKRDGPILGGVLALFLLIGAAMEFGPWRWGSPGGPAQSYPAPAFLDDATLDLSPEEASRRIAGGRLTLGELARLLNASKTDPLAKSFHKAFLAQPALRKAMRDYLADRDAAAFQASLSRAPEFAMLFSVFSRNEAFRSRAGGNLSGRAVSRPAESRASATSRADSLSMVRGRDVAQAHAAAVAALGESSGPAYGPGQGGGISASDQTQLPGESSGPSSYTGGGVRSGSGSSGAPKERSRRAGAGSPEACIAIAGACASTASACATSPGACAAAVSNCVSTSVACGGEPD